MTSRSRRKRRTTARSTPTTRRVSSRRTERASSIARIILFPHSTTLALLALLTPILLADVAKAASPSTEYSATERGAKLAWLPYRPSSQTARRLARTSTARTAYEQDAAVTDDPHQDPFGDRLAQPRGDLSRVSDVSRRRTSQLEPQPIGHPNALAQFDPPNPTGDVAPPARPPLLPLFTPEAKPAEPKQTKPEEDKTKPEEPAISKPANQPPLQPGEIPPVHGSEPVPEFQGGLHTQTKPQPEDECPPSGQFSAIHEISVNAPLPPGEVPLECHLKHETYVARNWSPMTYAWKASGACHKPLYFEDVQLERYGHSWGPYLQPVISQGHFFLTVPILPYLMGVHPPHECLYTLGYYRPGSCAPYMIDPLPISARGALLEAGVWTGAALLVP
ncbi:MAG: hypothetical protein JW818_04745 [Pirellulales bacterium]|nr:hypothetical protein [Pirellulales bacterium]